MYSIGLVTEEYFDDLMNLYGECFEQDSYYIEQFGSIDTKNKIIETCGDSFLHLIKSNWCYGIFDEGTLIGFINYFDYFKLKNNRRDLFNLLFIGTKVAKITYIRKIYTIGF